MSNKTNELFKLSNNFNKYKNINSILVFGNKSLINSPYITIAIPTYKRSDLLKHAIDSAINQVGSSCEYEIIIVDNETQGLEIGGNYISETEQLIRSYDEKNILYYRNVVNIGMFGNWNRCIELARGEWITILHDDDMLDKKFISGITQLLNKKKMIGAIANTYEIINNVTADIPSPDKKGFLKSLLKVFEKDKLIRVRAIDGEIMGNIYRAPTAGSIFKKQYLLELGGFDEDLFPSADWFFTYKFSKYYKFYLTYNRFGYYRLLENESLNPNTLQKFLVQAHQYYKFLSSYSIIGKMLDVLFDSERHYELLQWVKKMDKNNIINYEILSKELNYRYRPIRFRIYRCIKMVYWSSKRIISIFIG